MQLFNRYFFGHSAKHYQSLEELSEALLNREVDGILIDAYAGGTQKHLFSKPSVRVARVIDHQTAYGVVIGGDSMRLRHCFYGYMRSHQAEIFKWVEELVEPIKVRFKQGGFFFGGGRGRGAYQVYKCNFQLVTSKNWLFSLRIQYVAYMYQGQESDLWWNQKLCWKPMQLHCNFEIKAYFY